MIEISDVNLVAALVSLVGAFIGLLFFFWRAQAKRTQTIELLKESNQTQKDFQGKIQQQTQMLEKSIAIQDHTSETLERMEKALIRHEQENIQSHTRLVESIRKST